MTPQPHSKLPTEPGWWRRNASCGDDKHTYVNAVRIKDGVAEAYTPWDWSPCDLFTGEWVRCVGPLFPGDPGYEPEPPKPPLPDAKHRHADGCPHDGLWVFECGSMAPEFRYVLNRRELVLFLKHMVDIDPGRYGRYVKFIGMPSDFVPPPAVETPALEPCPWCGGETEVDDDDDDFVGCNNGKCNACGPNDDPDGAKWNRVARAARGAKP